MTTPFDPAGPFYEIINVVIAIAVMIVVDSALSPGRASDMANSTFKDVFKTLRKNLEDLFDVDQPDVRVHIGSSQDRLPVLTP